MRVDATPLQLPRPRPGDLVGQWHIVRTTFPMWLDPRNRGPSLNYARIETEPLALEDLVLYERRGRPKQIRGIDRQDPELPCRFVWRGRGLLALLTSEWLVVDLELGSDPEAEIMAIYFTKTLFTPAGLDLVSRSPTPNPALLDRCIERLRVEPGLAVHLDALVDLGELAAQRLSR